MMITFILTFFTLIFSSTINGYEQPREIFFDEKEEDQDILLRTLLTKKEIDQIVIFLKEKGIDATTKKSSSKQLSMLGDSIWNLYVPLVDAVDAITLLDEAGLPERKKINLFEEYVRRQREIYGNDDDATAEEIAKYMEGFAGIIDAEVLIKNEFLSHGKEEKIAALVYIQHDGVLDDPHGELAEKMKAYAIEKIPGLDPDRLTFITERKTPQNYKPLSFFYDSIHENFK